MKKDKLAALLVQTARRHPKAARRSAKFAFRHRRGLIAAARLARKTRRTPPRTLKHLADRRFRREVLAAIVSLRAAGARAQRLGAAKALTDKRVADLVGDATRRLAAAAIEHEPERRRHIGRKLAIAGVLATAFAAKARFGTAAADAK